MREPFLESHLQVDTGSVRGMMSLRWALPWQGAVPGERLACPDELGGRFGQAAEELCPALAGSRRPEPDWKSYIVRLKDCVLSSPPPLDLAFGASRCDFRCLCELSPGGDGVLAVREGRVPDFCFIFFFLFWGKKLLDKAVRQGNIFRTLGPAICHMLIPSRSLSSRLVELERSYDGGASSHSLS